MVLLIVIKQTEFAWKNSTDYKVLIIKKHIFVRGHCNGLPSTKIVHVHSSC